LRFDDAAEIKGGVMSTQSNSWLNYHHLYYFWRVAHEGSLSRAAAQLRLSHSTLSTQIRALEEHLQGELFVRSGRSLSLTALGRDILHYADEIFRLGAELSESVSGRSDTLRAPLNLGVVSTIPKLLIYRLVEPVLVASELGPLHLQQGSLDLLLERMAAGELHLILSEQHPPQGLSMHVYSRSLIEVDVCLYGTPSLAEKYLSGFPHSLQGAPLLLPSRGSGLRRRLDAWLAEHELSCRVIGEFDDTETMRLFGSLGQGLFPLHVAVTRLSVTSCRSGHLMGSKSRSTRCHPSEGRTVRMCRKFWREAAAKLHRRRRRPVRGCSHTRTRRKSPALVGPTRAGAADSSNPPRSLVHDLDSVFTQRE
jgi:LysR family transcriptional activator of nhaA